MLLCTIKTMGSPAWNEGNPSAPGPGVPVPPAATVQSWSALLEPETTGETSEIRGFTEEKHGKLMDFHGFSRKT